MTSKTSLGKFLIREQCYNTVESSKNVHNSPRLKKNLKTWWCKVPAESSGALVVVLAVRSERFTVQNPPERGHPRRPPQSPDLGLSRDRGVRATRRHHWTSTDLKNGKL
ncbi:hypothetical protein NL108_009632 [Boleophthalmus pectinirostris]|nr:hypothetical protein NL108_009632 [Boleophthalmus pectinirostris]